MKYHITETASFAAGILSQYSTGTVHSVYRKQSICTLVRRSLPCRQPPLLIPGQPDHRSAGSGNGSTVYPAGRSGIHRRPKHYDPFPRHPDHFQSVRRPGFDSFLPDQAVPVDTSAVKEAICLSGSGGFSELFLRNRKRILLILGKRLFLPLPENASKMPGIWPLLPVMRNLPPRLPV